MGGYIGIGIALSIISSPDPSYSLSISFEEVTLANFYFAPFIFELGEDSDDSASVLNIWTSSPIPK
jgi:hypothetical protein